MPNGQCSSVLLGCTPKPTYTAVRTNPYSKTALLTFIARPGLVIESNQIRGVLGRQLRILGTNESGVPPSERPRESVVQHIGTDLQQQMRAARRPPHLLLFFRFCRNKRVLGKLTTDFNDKV